MSFIKDLYTEEASGIIKNPTIFMLHHENKQVKEHVKEHVKGKIVQSLNVVQKTLMEKAELENLTCTEGNCLVLKEKLSEKEINDQYEKYKTTVVFWSTIFTVASAVISIATTIMSAGFPGIYAISWVIFGINSGEVLLNICINGYLKYAAVKRFDGQYETSALNYLKENFKLKEAKEFNSILERLKNDIEQM